MKFNHLSVERENHVATVVFNRPEKMNALNIDLMCEIIAMTETLQEDTDTRVVIFTGAGKCFSAGLDLGDPEFVQRFQDESTLKKRRFLKIGPRLIKALYDMDQITIAAINGAATGGGACIAAACDFRVGAENCRVGYPEVGLGMNLSWVALPMCVHLIGPARAKQMVILARNESATTLQSWGFLDAVVPAENLMTYARELAATYAAKPPIAAQMVKRSVNVIASALDQSIMHMDIDQFLLAANTEDFMEGVTLSVHSSRRDWWFVGSIEPTHWKVFIRSVRQVYSLFPDYFDGFHKPPVKVFTIFPTHLALCLARFTRWPPGLISQLPHLRNTAGNMAGDVIPVFRINAVKMFRPLGSINFPGHFDKIRITVPHVGALDLFPGYILQPNTVRHRISSILLMFRLYSKYKPWAVGKSTNSNRIVSPGVV